jgi:hypothetical protein
MAQVNSSPGQNQSFGNVAVVSAASAPGASDTRAKANAVTVTYNQIEPGNGPGPTNPLRK